jgi:hypothetical protein
MSRRRAGRLAIRLRSARMRDWRGRWRAS